jgi:hypothetical protein
MSMNGIEIEFKQQKKNLIKIDVVETKKGLKFLELGFFEFRGFEPETLKLLV